MSACSVPFHGCSVKIGDALAVMFSEGFTLDISANVDVAEDGLPDKLAPGTVNFVAEAICFFKQSGGQPEQY